MAKTTTDDGRDGRHPTLFNAPPVHGAFTEQEATALGIVDGQHALEHFLILRLYSKVLDFSSAEVVMVLL